MGVFKNNNYLYTGKSQRNGQKLIIENEIWFSFRRKRMQYYKKYALRS